MRTALVSDVHGNLLALQAVAGELEREGVEQVVYLGDLLYGGSQPVECLELVRERGWPAVIGNADAFVLDASTADDSPEPVTPTQLEVRAWTHGLLTPAQVEVVAGWPLALDVDLGHGRTLHAFHAAPASYHTVLLPSTPEEELRDALGGTEADLLAGGHTHLQFVRRVGASTFLNPGSAGFGYDHEQERERFAVDPWASYAVVTTSHDGWRIELRRVAFDGTAVAAALHEVGYPDAEARAAMWERGAAAAR